MTCTAAAPPYLHPCCVPPPPRCGTSGALVLGLQHELQVSIVDPRAGHGLGSYGWWVGAEDSPLLVRPDSPRLDPRRVRHTAVEGRSVPEAGAWLASRLRGGDDADFVAYHVNVTSAGVARLASAVKPTSRVRKSPHASTRCTSARDALRRVFWSVPQFRDRCRAVFRQHLCGAPVRGFGTCEAPAPGSGWQWDWTVAVHMRRGDAVRLGKSYRLQPVGYFVGMTQRVLGAIAKLQPGANVAVMVFSEGVNGTVMVDLDGRAVIWHALPVCRRLGLCCKLLPVLHSASVLDTVDCMAAADVLIGSGSSLSYLAGALSTNVKLLPAYWLHPRKNKLEGRFDNGDGWQDALTYIRPETGRWQQGAARREPLSDQLAAQVGVEAAQYYRSSVPGVVNSLGQTRVFTTVPVPKSKREVLRRMMEGGLWRPRDETGKAIARVIKRWARCAREAVEAGRPVHRAVPWAEGAAHDCAHGGGAWGA